MGPAAEGIALAIAQSDRTAPSIDVVGAVKAFRMRVALRLAGHRPPDHAAGSRSRRVVDERVPEALESRHLTLVPRSQGVIDRPAKVDIQEVLTAWRAAERALGAIAEGDAEWALVHARFVNLRASYHQLFAERCDRQPRSELPRRVVDRREVAEGLP